MKTREVVFTVAIILGLAVPAAWAGRHLPEERGKALFQNQRAFGGQVACNSCHPGGRGLEQSGAKASFRFMNQTHNSLEDAINFCIVNANKGKAIANDSPEMKDIAAYIKSLAPKAPAVPGYGR